MVKGYPVPDGFMGWLKIKGGCSMSYTLFNVPMYNERKAIHSLKRKGYTKITVVARQNFTLTITGRREVD